MGGESGVLSPTDLSSADQSGLEISELEQLVAWSGVVHLPIEARKYSVHRIVEHHGRRFKVRAFRTPGAAQRQLNFIRRVSHLFPHCHGRIDRCLIWDYESGAPVPEGRSVMADIGAFMAGMSQSSTAPLAEGVFDRWCEDIQRAGLFFGKTLGFLKSYFSDFRPNVPSWNLEYLDAVPKNFIYNANGRFLSIDGKHIFSGPRGLGLIKLKCHAGYLISEGEYQQVVRSYRQLVDIPEFDDPKYLKFLLFYYCMVLLADNAQFISRRCNLESARTRWRKQLVFETVDIPRLLRWTERAVSWLAYYACRTQTRTGQVVELFSRRGK